MKLVRFGPPGEERPGLWLEEDPVAGEAAILDVRAMAFDIEDYDPHFFSHAGLDRLRGLLAEPDRKRIPASGVRLGPPIAPPRQIVCLGKNYADHVAEFDAETPRQPIFFAKAPSSVIGPFDPIRLPADATRVDTEVELAVVIGRRARRVGEGEALHCVAGYAVLDDVTDRDAQRADGQWFRAKSADSFCPLGPWLVTPDEVADPHALRLRARINGRALQDNTTANMIFKIPFLIASLSARITLEPGDVVATGTPGGIGSARTPPVLLREGDTVEMEIERVGRQVNPVQRKGD